MDYAFFKVTIKVIKGNGEDSVVQWIQLSRLISASEHNNGSVVEYFNGVDVQSITIKETPEEVFGSVVFVKSPMTYYVDTNNPTMPTIG